MDAHTVKLVQDSRREVLPIANQAGALCCGNLFEAAPELRPPFKGERASRPTVCSAYWQRMKSDASSIRDSTLDRPTGWA